MGYVIQSYDVLKHYCIDSHFNSFSRWDCSLFGKQKRDWTAHYSPDCLTENLSECKYTADYCAECGQPKNGRVVSLLWFGLHPPSNSPWCGLPSLALSSTVLATIFSISIVRIRIPSSPDTFHSTEKIKTVVRMRMMVMMMTINVNFALAHTRLMVFLHGLMLNHPPSRAAPTWTLLVSIQCLACLPSCLAHSLARLAERRRDQFTTSVTFQPHTPHTHSHGGQSTLTGLQSGYEEYSCVECLLFLFGSATTTTEGLSWAVTDGWTVINKFNTVIGHIYCRYYMVTVLSRQILSEEDSYM